MNCSQDLANYLKNKKGFQRVMILLKEKYISLGRFSGTILLKNITKDEANALTDFFSKIYSEKSDIKISYAMLDKVLKESRFATYNWHEVLQYYFAKNIVDKKTKKLKDEQEKTLFFADLLQMFDEEERKLFKLALEEKELKKIINYRYKKQDKQLATSLYYLIHFTVHISKYAPTSLVMLSSLTGNPHFLDATFQNYHLFMKLMALHYKQEEPQDLNSKITFWQQYGIAIDNVSNFAICYHLISDTKLISSSFDEDEILNLNLSNLNHIENLDTKEKVVYVFENPSLIEALKYLQLPIVITYGIPNLCVYKIIEKLILSGNQIYYNGDFDPEGLIIATKLKMKFPCMHLFCYDEINYQASMPIQSINESRLKKLEQVNVIELEQVKQSLLKVRKAGYQERNIKNIINFMIENKRT